MPSPRTFAHPRADRDASGGRGFLWVLASAVAAGWLLLASQLPAPLILPALSLAMVGAGCVLAAALYLSGSRLTSALSTPSTLSAPWEVACALVFLGFAAGILGDAGEAVAVLDEISSGLAQRPQ
jgi:hypothetical protein